MKKLQKIIYSLLVCTTLLFFAGEAFANPIVADILIEGNSIVDSEEIIDNLPFEPGDTFEQEEAVSAVEDLYAMEKFEDISVYAEDDESGNVIVIYSVKEKPYIEKIEFKGNENISSRRLRKEIEISEGDFLDDFAFRDQKEVLESYYRENGYAAVNVNEYKNVDEDNRATLTFHIEEGNKIEVESLNIIGVLEGDYKKVRDLIDLKSSHPYREKELREGLEKIKEHYLNSGYLDVEVSEPFMNFDRQGKKAFITIFLSEGRQYKVGDVSFSGNEVIDDGKLLNRALLKSGDVYSEEKLEMSVALLQERYAEIGRVNTGVVPSHDYRKEDNKVDITYNIYEGPEVSVRNIHISGNHRTKDYVIRREITVEEGEPFDLQDIRRSQEKIFRLGFFKDVTLDMAPAEREDEMDIIFVVEEQQTGMASIGAGYSSQDGVMGTLQVSQENFMGRGQSISAMWEFGKRVQNYRVSFSEPYLFQTPTPFRASIFNTVRTRRFQTGDNYKERRRGGSLSLGRHFTDIFSANTKYALEEVKIYNVDTDIQDEVSEETRMTSSLTPGISLDTRDYPFDPRTGYYLRFSNQVAGGIFGGNVSFSKFESKKTYFQPLINNIVGVLNLELGSAYPYGQTEEIPVYERFYVGGSESVRGYEYYEIEGDHKAFANAEIKFPIVRERRQTILQGAVFFDLGGAWKDIDDFSFEFGEGNLRRGFGAGIRFKTMAFPIRIDWGYGIDRDDPGGRWYFTMGEIF
ncbi:MAG: outer membrane protein assembly factor BamA [Elusimicrobiota bacterium]